MPNQIEVICNVVCVFDAKMISAHPERSIKKSTVRPCDANACASPPTLAVVGVATEKPPTKL